MFGLQTGSSGKGPHEEATFDLEKEIINDREKGKEYLRRIESRLQKLKKDLRTGEGSEVYQSLGEILNGYTSVVKVISRIVHSSKKG